MDYLGERYPDLAESDLKELFQLGMRFCRPAIPHGRPGGSSEAEESEEDSTGEVEAVSEAQVSEAQRQPVGAGAEDTATA